jgi:N6-adenosine-specific RNA methylase IME4
MSAFHNIPALIDRSSARLMAARNSAEVLEAKAIAEAALHYARVTKAANETHADCLRIITRAEMRMANEVDAAQKRGEVANDGQHGEAVQTSDSLGLDRRRVSEWREVRDAGEQVVEGAIKTALAEGRAPTKSEILEAAKAIRAERVDAKRAEKLAATVKLSERNTTLPIDQRKYSAIYADPPWSFDVWSGAGKDRAAENHYPTMSQAEIEALPVARLAADDCALFLWAVMPQLPEALRVIEAWGFSYKTCAFVWVKQTRDEERFATGMGYWTRANAELCLLATRGSPPRLNADVHQVVMSPRLDHSRKPDEVASRIERLVPGPYMELFSRQARNGWEAWGNQANAA